MCDKFICIEIVTINIFLGTLIVSSLAFWLFNLPFLIVDTTGRPSFILQYKIQDNKNVPVSVCVCL